MKATADRVVTAAFRSTGRGAGPIPAAHRGADLAFRMTFEAGRTPGGWLASDGRWYPAEVHPNHQSGQQAPRPSHPRASEQTKLRIIRSALTAGILAGCTAIALILASTGSSANDLTGKSARQVRAIALAATKAEHSVHISSFSGSTDVSPTEGRQTISGGTLGNATVLVVSGVAYLDGDATFLETTLGLSPANAASYVGRWIAFHPTDPDYQEVAAGVTMASMLTEVM